jgi:hypothetical protein
MSQLEVVGLSWQILCRLASAVGVLASHLSNEREVPLVFTEAIADVIEAVCEYSKCAGIQLDDCDYLFLAKKSGSCSPQVELSVIIADMHVLFKERVVMEVVKPQTRQALRGIFISCIGLLNLHRPGESISEILEGKAP